MSNFWYLGINGNKIGPMEEAQAKAMEALEGEVGSMNLYLSGQVYIFSLTDLETNETETLGDCFYGDPDKGAVDFLLGLNIAADKEEAEGIIDGWN
jgi:hypothetical protein